jgi:hypothetical protein
VFIAVMGVGISMAFFFIEVRNKELVDAGGKWLDYLELNEIGVTIRRASNTSHRRPLLYDSIGHYARGGLPGWKTWYSHAAGLRVIYSLTALSFIAMIGGACFLLGRGP